MDGRPTRINCDVPNVLSQRDLVSRPDNMDETVLSSSSQTDTWQKFHCRRTDTLAEWANTLALQSVVYHSGCDTRKHLNAKLVCNNKFSRHFVIHVVGFLESFTRSEVVTCTMVNVFKC